MIAALTIHAPKGVIWNKPKGGYYIWCHLPAALSANRLVVKAAENKVSFIPGTRFTAPGRGRFIRLNFTYAPKNSIEEGVRLLCRQ
jgi:DNA-binding transcriptional MocR family regulator